MDNKFNIGDAVFFYTMIDRIPGVITGLERVEECYLYTIRISSNYIATKVPEHRIETRTLFNPPKYKLGDTVSFEFKGEIHTGQIFVVDRYGTFEQAEEPSYDIRTPEFIMKHVRESLVIAPDCNN